MAARNKKPVNNLPVDPQTGQIKRGPGRPRGSADKANIILKPLQEMVMDSFRAVGGQKYLEDLARTDKKAYMMLVTKLMPSMTAMTNIAGTESAPMTIQIHFDKDDETSG